MGSGGPSKKGGVEEGDYLSFTEIASEFVYNGKDLSTLAGATDVQLQEVYFRRRDKQGRLRRTAKGEEWVADPSDDEDAPTTYIKERASFEDMFRDVWSKRGLTEEEVETRWQHYLDKNPRLKKLYEAGEEDG